MASVLKQSVIRGVLLFLCATILCGACSFADWRDKSVNFFKLLQSKSIFTWEQDDQSGVNRLYGVRFRLEEDSKRPGNGNIYGDVFLVEGDHNDIMTLEASYFENATQLSFLKKDRSMSAQDRETWKGQFPISCFIHYNEGNNKIMMGVVDQPLEPATQEQLKELLAARSQKAEQSKELFKKICAAGKCYSAEWKQGNKMGILILVFKSQNLKRFNATGEIVSDTDLIYRKKFRARLESGRLILCMDGLVDGEIPATPVNLQDPFIFNDMNQFEFELNAEGFTGTQKRNVGGIGKLTFTEDEEKNYDMPSDKAIADRKAKAKECQESMEKYTADLRKRNEETRRRIASEQPNNFGTGRVPSFPRPPFSAPPNPFHQPPQRFMAGSPMAAPAPRPLYSSPFGGNAQQNVVVIVNNEDKPDTSILSMLIQLNDKQFVGVLAALCFLKENSIDVPKNSTAKQVYQQASNYAKNNDKLEEWNKIRSEAKKNLTEKEIRETRIRIQTILDITHPD